MNKNWLYILRLSTGIVVFILTILAVTGLYPLKLLNIQFLPLFQRVIADFSILALLMFMGLILLTFIFGRIYCSILCPLGILQELIGFLTPNRQTLANSPIKYFIAALVFGLILGGSAFLAGYIAPYTIFASAIMLSIYSLGFIIALIILTIFKNRFFCTNICPVGTLLGLISKFSLLKINIDKSLCSSCGMCENICKLACINSKEKTVNNATCIKCLKCLTACQNNGVKYSFTKDNIEFNPTRRNIILGLSALTLFGAAIKTGIELTKSNAKKIKRFILPPGARSVNSLELKCFNCDLCINNCPNKILTKKNSEINAVHIDYTIGKGYCEYNCIECSKVCPTGAIKKISLEEKQKTRIAMVNVNQSICTNCGNCVSVCPTKALNIIRGQLQVDFSKCIGCGKCKTVCSNNAIEISPVNRHYLLS